MCSLWLWTCDVMLTIDHVFSVTMNLICHVNNWSCVFCGYEFDMSFLQLITCSLFRGLWQILWSTVISLNIHLTSRIDNWLCALLRCMYLFTYLLTITTKAVSSNPAHGEMYSIQHYVIIFVCDLRQVCGFLGVLRCPSPIKLTATI